MKVQPTGFIGDAMDEALEILAGTGPEFGGGLANHGPMAAEALVTMGRDDAVVSWVRRYRNRLEGPVPPREKIDPNRWSEALGDERRSGDWVALFDRELAENPWPDVLDSWVRRLSPGPVASATHGVIRTGHAVRSLASRDTERRRHELSEGLGYWAATFQRLPTVKDGGAQRTSAAEAIRKVETLRRDHQVRSGLITNGLRALDDLPSFAGVIDLLDVSGDTSRVLSDLTTTFAHVYLANAPSSGRRITFVHAVTGPSALRLIAPHVHPETAKDALRYAWQAGAALYAAFGDPGSREAAPTAASDIQALIDRAVATQDEHAIKLTEACLREHALNPDAVYLAAASEAADHLRG